MKTTAILALSGLLTVLSVPTLAQAGGLVLPSAPRNAAEQRLNDRIEMQVRANEARGLTNSRAIQQREVRRDRRDHNARRWEHEDRRERRDDRRRERRGDGW